ncbi:unnamed protein product [Musa acuminata var. zebrina]
MGGGGGGVGRDREGRGRVVSGKGGAATKGGRWMRDRGRGAATRRGPEMNGEEGRGRKQEKGVCDGEGGRGGKRERFTGRRRSSRRYCRSPMDRKTQQPPLAEENAAVTRARRRKTPPLLPPFAGGDEVSRRAPRKRSVKERLSSVHEFFKQPQPDPGLLLKYYDGTQANIAYMGFRGINTNTLCAHSKCYIQTDLTTNLPSRGSPFIDIGAHNCHNLQQPGNKWQSKLKTKTTRKEVESFTTWDCLNGARGWKAA